ncbi:M23 family metallopeptidase [Actinoplanes aureus]|uniref:M23 family metallopeptidase n=1 Tax=Actinoplanes aureus TaxID=2792083 RepID=A0A931G417_9ACTN|nr:M23 family metallopeptidase [Actinoplanes aureus]MBG0567526.1 M23 family metallopeptidase [Actinoplanes aureus]
MKPLHWAAALAAAPLLLCVAGILVAIGDEPAGATCASPTASAQARVREHVGAVGQWDSAAIDNAAIIVAVGQQRQLPPRAWVIAVATAMTESSLINVRSAVDHDSLGLFQQRPSQGWGTPQQLVDRVYAAGKFYDALLKIKGWEKLALTVAAQKVQRSDYPDAYAKHEDDAEKVVAKVTGAASITDLPGASLADCDTSAQISAHGWVRPVNAPVGSPYGPREGKFHHGVDLSSKRYTVIRAASGGRVLWSGCDPGTGNCNVDGTSEGSGCGWYVDILHAGEVGTRYCHLVRKPDVAEGDTVNAGDPIGLMGSSGRSSGVHLHYEVHLNVCGGNGGNDCDLDPGNSTNPVPFMRNVQASLAE